MTVEIRALMVSNILALAIDFCIMNCMLTNPFVSRDFEHELMETSGTLNWKFISMIQKDILI